MSLFDEDDGGDNIFAAPAKPRKANKKPSFEQLLDDDSDLFPSEENYTSSEVFAAEPEAGGAEDAGLNTVEAGGAGLNTDGLTTETKAVQIPPRGVVNGKSPLFDDEDAHLGESLKDNDDDDFVMVSPADVPVMADPNTDPNTDPAADTPNPDTDTDTPESTSDTPDSQDLNVTDGPSNLDKLSSYTYEVYNTELTYEERKQLRKEKREKQSAGDGKSEASLPNSSYSPNQPPKEVEHELWALTNSLQLEQSEKSSLQCSNEQLGGEVAELRERVALLEEEVGRQARDILQQEEQLKQKDAQIAELTAKLSPPKTETISPKVVTVSPPKQTDPVPAKTHPPIPKKKKVPTATLR